MGGGDRMSHNNVGSQAGSHLFIMWSGGTPTLVSY